jgi:hypothetical protein
MHLNVRKAIFILTLGLISISFASAHAILVRSTPGANETLTGHNVAVALTFNSKVDQARSTLTLEGPDHSTSRLQIKVNPSSATSLGAGVLKLAPGPYKLHWQVLAVDGHITRGEIDFSVK